METTWTWTEERFNEATQEWDDVECTAEVEFELECSRDFDGKCYCEFEVTSTTGDEMPVSEYDRLQDWVLNNLEDFREEPDYYREWVDANL